MNLLVLESSSAHASWAWLTDGHCVQSETVPGRASSALAVSLARWQTTSPPPPHRILVGVGPGSFSGIRAAIACAQGLARVWGCPVEPVRSSHAIGRVLNHVTFLGVFADAKRGQLFFTAYENGRMTRPSCLIPFASLPDYLSKCTRAVATGPLPGLDDVQIPQARDLASYWLEHGPEPTLPLEPIYLHPQAVAI